MSSSATTATTGKQNKPRTKRPFGSIRCRSVTHLFYPLFLRSQKCYWNLNAIFAVQCNQYGLTKKCECSPQPRYAVMIQSKVSRMQLQQCNKFPALHPFIVRQHVHGQFTPLLYHKIILAAL